MYTTSGPDTDDGLFENEPTLSIPFGALVLLILPKHSHALNHRFERWVTLRKRSCSAEWYISAVERLPSLIIGL